MKNNSENASLDNSNIMSEKKIDKKLVKPIPADNQGRIFILNENEIINQNQSNKIKENSFFQENNNGSENLSNGRSSFKKSLIQNAHSRSMPKLSQSNMMMMNDNSSHYKREIRDDSQTDDYNNLNFGAASFRNPQIRPNIPSPPQMNMQLYHQHSSPNVGAFGQLQNNPHGYYSNLSYSNSNGNLKSVKISK